MKKNFTLSFLALLLWQLLSVAQAPLVSMQNGHLVYNKYANERQTNAVNQVPDFSNAGYKGGGVSLPVLPVVKTVEAVEGDCRLLIQAAIDEVAALTPDANGFRGAVLLKAGVYKVEGTLTIRASGVVLRGEGTGLHGTVVIATKQEQHNLLAIQGAGSGYAEVSGSRFKITTSYLATGTTTVDVAAGHHFVAGDNIVIQRTPTENWIDTLDMRQYGWTASAYKNTYERKVVSVQGNTLTLDAPIVDPLEDSYGGGDVFKSNVTGRINNSGVENMRLESYFANNDDESHGWNAIIVTRAEHCWVKQVVAKYFGYAAVNLSNMTHYTTVEDCALIDPKSVTTGGRKYSFNLESNATCNLFQRCFTWGGRHDYVSGSRVPGPNVFLDCLADNTQSDLGPHHRWATGQLYDNIFGGQIHVQNRKDLGSGHGWAGAQIMFWNCYSYKNDIRVESPPTAKNWGIGCVGLTQNGGGYWESWGTPVLPRSLYLQQLQDRLGAQAVQNIVNAEQAQGRIWDSLRARGTRIAQEPKVPIGPVAPGTSFDITDNGGSITAQYPNTSKPTEDAPSLIDNSTTTKYYRSGHTNLWVQYQSPLPAIVTRYTVTSANDVPERDPKNWNLLGSNDGVNWVTLDSQLNQSFASRFLTKTYTTTDSTIAYTYFRLHITANNGQTGTQFAEWELFERRTQTIAFSAIPDQTYGDDPFELVASSNAGLPVTLEVVAGPGVLSEEFVTINGAGTITLRASQASNDQYFPAVAEKTVLVNKATQSIAFATIPPGVKGQQVALSATATTGLPVSFSVVSGAGTVTGNNLRLNDEGLITVQADQPGNENYEAAPPVQQTVLVLGLDYLKDGIGLLAYPNPTSGPLKVKFRNKGGRTYSFLLINGQGSVVMSSTVPANNSATEVNFNLSGLQNGFYFLHATDGTEKTVRLIVKY